MSHARLILALVGLLTLPHEHVAHAGLFGRGAPAARATADTAQAPKRGLAVRLKAGWRKIGKVGQVATVLVAGSAAAFGMHHMGLSPQETALAIGGVATVGTGTLAVLAQRARALWTRSAGAQRLSAVDSALERKKIGEVPGLIASIKTELAASGATAANPKDQAREAAYLNLALVRAELALNEADYSKSRLAGTTLPEWNTHLGGLDAAATKQVSTTSEGKLAHGLRALGVEIEGERAIVARHGEALTRFEDQVPLAFGGAMSKQGKLARTLAAKMSEEEMGGEITLHGALNTAMRGRVSDRLAVEKPEFLQRRTRLRGLTALREGDLSHAIHQASSASAEFSSAESDLRMAALKESEAAQHTADVEHYTETVYGPADEQGNRTETQEPRQRTVDNSGTYRTQAAAYASSASSHVSRGNDAMEALSQRLTTLQGHPMILAEGLNVTNHGARAAESGPGWFGELFMPGALNTLSNWSAQSSISSAKAHADSKLGALQQLDAEVAHRESGEARWVGGQIDGDLSRQMASVSP